MAGLDSPCGDSNLVVSCAKLYNDNPHDLGCTDEKRSEADKSNCPCWSMLIDGCHERDEEHLQVDDTHELKLGFPENREKAAANYHASCGMSAVIACVRKNHTCCRCVVGQRIPSDRGGMGGE